MGYEVPKEEREGRVWVDSSDLEVEDGKKGQLSREPRLMRVMNRC